MPQPFHFRKLSDLSEKVAKPYTDARAQVLHSKTCVYHSRFRDSVEWVRDGNCHKLVLKPDTPTSPEVAPKMAVLSLVCAVSSEDFWMTADGGWKGPSAITKTFSAVKPSCTLEAPSIDVLRDDYVTGIGNLRWVQDQVATHGVSKKQGLLVPASADAAATHIKIKHKLFEPLTEPADAEGDEEDAGDGENFPFTIKNWPTYSDFAAAALDNMKDTYRVLPIPAYEQGGGLMYPTMYKHQLVGATVILNFSLTHWFIPAKPGQMQEASDIYSAEVLGIRVIRPPLPTIVSPRKRKVSTIDPFDESGSPSKKSKSSN